MNHNPEDFPTPRDQSDVALDETLARVHAQILDRLESSLDVETLLQTLLASRDHDRPHPGATAESPPTEPRPRHQLLPPSTSSAAVEQVLDQIRAALDLLPAIAEEKTARLLGAAPASIQASGWSLIALVYGLGDRSVTRDEALRLARLALHNLTEARHLAAAHSTHVRGRRSRRRTADLAEDLLTAEALTGELRPAVLRLFDPADDHAPAKTPV